MRILNDWRSIGVVLVVRAAAMVLGVYGAWLAFGTADLNGIWVAAAGGVLWNAGVWMHERSPGLRLLMSTRVANTMRTHAIRVPGSWSVATVKNATAGTGGADYCVTLQDGSEAGIALLDELHAIGEAEAHHTPVYSVARPISYATSVRMEDPVLSAFDKLQQRRDKFVVVLDAQDRVAGIISKADIARVLAQPPAERHRPAAQPFGLMSTPGSPR